MPITNTSPANDKEKYSDKSIDQAYHPASSTSPSTFANNTKAHSQIDTPWTSHVKSDDPQSTPQQQPDSQLTTTSTTTTSSSTSTPTSLTPTSTTAPATPPTMSSYASSTTSSTSSASSSSMHKLLDKAHSTFARRPNNALPLAADEAHFQRQQAKAADKQKRRDEYKRLGLDQATKFGMPGAQGSWQSG